MMKKEMLLAMFTVGCVANSALGMVPPILGADSLPLDELKIINPDHSSYLLGRKQIKAGEIFSTGGNICHVWKREVSAPRSNGNQYYFLTEKSIPRNTVKWLSTNAMYCHYAIGDCEVNLLIKEGNSCAELAGADFAALMHKQYKLNQEAEKQNKEVKK